MVGSPGATCMAWLKPGPAGELTLLWAWKWRSAAPAAPAVTASLYSYGCLRAPDLSVLLLSWKRLPVYFLPPLGVDKG